MHLKSATDLNSRSPRNCYRSRGLKLSQFAFEKTHFNKEPACVNQIDTRTVKETFWILLLKRLWGSTESRKKFQEDLAGQLSKISHKWLPLTLPGSFFQGRGAIELFICFCFYSYNLVIKMSQGVFAQWHMELGEEKLFVVHTPQRLGAMNQAVQNIAFSLT